MKVFVRNNLNQIIGTREILEEYEKVNKIIKLENLLKEYNLKIINSCSEKDKNIKRLLVEYYESQIDIVTKEINRIYSLPTYRYEEVFNFHSEPSELKCMTYVPEKKKQKIKAINSIFRLQRDAKKNSDNRPITLNSEYYK